MGIAISKSKKPEKSLMPEYMVKVQFHLDRKAHRILQNIKIKNEHMRI